jgi:hypothetical protein
MCHTLSDSIVPHRAATAAAQAAIPHQAQPIAVSSGLIDLGIHFPRSNKIIGHISIFIYYP